MRLGYCSINNRSDRDEFYEAIENDSQQESNYKSKSHLFQNETQPLLNPTRNINTTTNQIIANYSIDSNVSSYSRNNMPNSGNIKKSHRWNRTNATTTTTSSNEVDSFQAFLTLIFIFLINSTTLASLKVYGVIFERIVAEGYYTREQASWPVSTASTIQNLAGFLTPILAMRLSWRSIEIIQALMFVIANVGAYFSESLAMDIVCLSIIQGVAFSIRYNMNVVINNEYFHRYRATAMGVSLAGSSCGVIVLKPFIEYVLDSSGPNNFRNAYLALATVMSINILFGFFIRKPKVETIDANNDGINGSIRQDDSLNSTISSDNENDQIDFNSLSNVLINLLKNPCIHCIWIMQTIYFYISRTYTIFIIDFGVGKGFELNDSRSLLSFWIYGEIGGRLLLGGFVDSKLLNIKWNIIFVNFILGLSGFALILDPAIFSTESYQEQQQQYQLLQAQNTSQIIASQSGEQMFQQHQTTNNAYFWFSGSAIAITAAMSSLLNIMIVPFGQEYLGKKNVPWSFALGSIVTGVLLFFRPVLIGLSRDKQKSYDLLIIILSSGPCIYGFLFLLAEPFLKFYKYRRIQEREISDSSSSSQFN